MGKFLKYLAVATIGCSTILCTNACQDLSVNVWKKVSTDALNPGAIIDLDMSKGYSFTERGMIFLVLMTTDSSEQIVVAFPDGGYWVAPKPDPFLEALQEEFDSLEAYLKSKGTEIKKK